MLLCLQGGSLANASEASADMPTEKTPPAKRAVTIRLPADLLGLIEEEAIVDGRSRLAGRVYSPSATIERILRAYFASKPKKRSRPAK
jgi:hypothetical protein